MKLIDADYFIDFIKGMYKRAGWNDRDIHMSLADVISNLDNVPTVTNIYNWIPVTENLPDEEGRYFVTIEVRDEEHDRSTLFVLRALFQMGPPSEWIIESIHGNYINLDWVSGAVIQRVVAWVPDPEPYNAN